MIRLGRRKRPPLRGKPRPARVLDPRQQRQKVARRRPAVGGGRPWWSRLAWGVMRLSLVAFLFSLVTAALLGGYTALATSQRFTVKRAEVAGTRQLSRLEILRAAGVGSHSNLLALPVGRIQARVQALPWVRHARVNRRLPDTVRIEVREFDPQLLVLADGAFYVVDCDHLAHAPIAQAELPDRPVVSGLSKADLAAPGPEARRLIAAARRVLELLPAPDTAPGGRLSELHLDRVWGISLVYRDLRPTLRLGFTDFTARLERLKAVLSDLRRRGELEQALLIDLSYPRRVVVRLEPKAPHHHPAAKTAANRGGPLHAADNPRAWERA